MEKIGFIGMGNMGSAMLNGILKSFPSEDVLFTRANKEKGELFSREKKILYVKSNSECAEKAKYLIIAIKPIYFFSVLKEIKEKITKEHVIISIAAGITINDIKEILDKDVRIVRAMPNTSALVGEGMTGVCYNELQYTKKENEIINRIMGSFGKVEKIEEHLMNAVICVSGSSPAFVYLFIEALADAGVEHGLSREAAYTMAAQTVLGAAKMVLETKEHPGVLKDRVCSPGGTTIAGIAALEEYGFRNAVIKAAERCYWKAEDMNQKRKNDR